MKWKRNCVLLLFSCPHAQCKRILKEAFLPFLKMLLAPLLYCLYMIRFDSNYSESNFTIFLLSVSPLQIKKSTFVPQLDHCYLGICGIILDVTWWSKWEISVGHSLKHLIFLRRYESRNLASPLLASSNTGRVQPTHTFI